jgi:hypothetical protein
MSSQRLISDARRRAKQLARVSGRPHQTHLDEIARDCGRLDWQHFIDDPVALRADEAEGPAVAEMTTPACPNGDEERDRTELALLRIGGLGMGMTILGTAMMALVMALSVSPIVSAPIVRDHIDEAAGVVTLVMTSAAMLIGVPAVLVLAMTVLVTFGRQSWLKFTKPRGRRLFVAWRGALARAAYAVAVPWLAMLGLPILVASVPIGDVISYQDDVSKGRFIHFADKSRPLAYSSVRILDGGRRAILLTLIDQRTIPRRIRAGFDPKSIDQRIKTKLVDHPVLRAQTELDCATGRLKLRRLEAADSMTAAPVVTVPFVRTRRGPYKGMLLESGSITELCAAAPRVA